MGLVAETGVPAGPSVAETIRELTRRHLEERDGLLLGENISAVGWVNGTVPPTKNIVELPMTDVAGSGFAVGAALVGRRPIFVVRFQDFLVLNGSALINYAAKTLELHGVPAPMMIRALAIDNIGPCHSGVLHSIFMHFPGFKVFSPMTPAEVAQTFDAFAGCDGPILVSEHRSSYDNRRELPDVVLPDADVVLYATSNTRFALAEAATLLAGKGIRASQVHLFRLKPLDLGPRVLEPLRSAGCGLVVDPGYEICGAAQSIAFELMSATGRPVGALGLEDRSKLLVEPRNSTPNAHMIAAAAERVLRRGS